ncbi:hypothetical protein [Pannonibacter carbonis]|uniref:hypothetical protein n=1 Tax=Pannonibacter carbonis TaxID=2067569 RepID=UPI000D0FBD96|nr:hypothetical protein [Pannonibacter carbonis]
MTRTLADLLDAGHRLGVTCAACHRFRYLRETRLDETLTLSALSAGLRCATCGSNEITLTEVARDPANGKWPAERS